LADYRCVIDDLVTAGSRAAARMTFTAIHRGVLFDVPATGRVITWVGAAFFTIAQNRVTRLWVIGDIDAVKRQLGVGASDPF
jgi:predicted ester cyclase